MFVAFGLAVWVWSGVRIFQQSVKARKETESQFIYCQGRRLRERDVSDDMTRWDHGVG